MVLSGALVALMASGLAGQEPSGDGTFRFGEVLREGDGPRDLVLMPCLGCDAHSWTEFMARNRTRFRMVALTWPGMGATALPEVVPDSLGTPYFDYLVNALRLIVERESLRRPVIVGHSAAAVLAVRFAAEHPELVSGVVNVDAVVANGDTYGFDRARRRAWADAEMRGVLARYDNDSSWAKLNAAPGDMPAHRAAFYERMWRTPPRAHVFAYWRDWLRTDVGVLLPILRVPFFAIHALPADSDRAAAIRTDIRDRYRRAPMPVGGRVVFVEGSSHTVWEYRPDAFDAALAAFALGSVVETAREP